MRVTDLIMAAKKGMEMGVQTLIYIAIGLAILAISVIVYFSVVEDGQQSMRDCDNLGGTCIPDDDPCSGTVNFFGSCPSDEKCCVNR